MAWTEVAVSKDIRSGQRLGTLQRQSHQDRSKVDRTRNNHTERKRREGSSMRTILVLPI